MDNENLPHFIVKVCNGSGCLYQTTTDKYCYVLTAKHVLEDQEKITVSSQYLDHQNECIAEELELIGEPYKHPDENKDAAILKVKVHRKIDSLIKVENVENAWEDYQLIGHPLVRRRENEYSIRVNEIKIRNTKPYGYIEAELGKIATYEEINGQSGGGILRAGGKHVFLAGIQTRMAAEDRSEQLGRIEFMPISFFDEIIEYYKNDLTPLTPYYLSCFSTLKDYVLKLDGCFDPQNVAFTSIFLKEMTDGIVQNNVTPDHIKNYFQKRLLVYNEHQTVLSHKALWVAWLEFLIIIRCIRDEHVTTDNVGDIFNDYRLIYSSTTQDWGKELSNILRSDFKGLNENAKIIVATDSIPIKPVIPVGAIPNIVRANPITQKQMKIDEGIEHPLRSFKLIHINAFQRYGIIEKELEYFEFSALTETELQTKLKNEFTNLFADPRDN